LDLALEGPPRGFEALAGVGLGLGSERPHVRLRLGADSLGRFFGLGDDLLRALLGLGDQFADALGDVLGEFFGAHRGEISGLGCL
jgi:hypothetical protein